MLYRWRWIKTRPHDEGYTHWVWDSDTAEIRGYRGSELANRFQCTVALVWFRDHTDSWEQVDTDLDVDEGL